jgi:hypothetical protein
MASDNDGVAVLCSHAAFTLLALNPTPLQLISNQLATAVTEPRTRMGITQGPGDGEAAVSY